MQRYFNPHQPQRPTHDEDGTALNYATRPERGNRVMRIYFCKPEAMIAQTRLYRACLQGIIPQHVGIGDLYLSLFQDISKITIKKQMGQTVLQSLTYEPRKLKHVSSYESPISSYVFHNVKDLTYGLEWQICTWLNNILVPLPPARPVTDEQWREANTDLLSFLGTATDDEFDNIEDTILESVLEEPTYPDMSRIAENKFYSPLKKGSRPDEDPLAKWREISRKELAPDPRANWRRPPDSEGT